MDQGNIQVPDPAHDLGAPVFDYRCGLLTAEDFDRGVGKSEGSGSILE
jgi:hypothetical protein